MSRLSSFPKIILILTVSFLILIPVAVSAAGGLSAPLNPPAADYDIECTVKIDSLSIEFQGTETISLVNNSSHPLEYLAFDWSFDSLHSCRIIADGAPVEILSPTDSGAETSPVVIALPEPINPGEQLNLTVPFGMKDTYEPGDTRYPVTSWFPRIYWGFRTRDNFTVRLHYPEEYTLATTGKYDPEMDRYIAEGIRRYGVYFAKNMEVMQGQAGGVKIRVFYTKAGTECARLIMNTAVDAIDFYRERFGFFPFDHLTVVPGMDAPNGGYPAATALVVIHGMERMSEREKIHWQWITAHELGHQYWYEHVLSADNDQFGWLMIGLGIYVDREYSRYRHLGNSRYRQLMNRYIEGVREGLDTRADVEDSYLDNVDFDFNNVVIHGKGYSIISALNYLLGDSLFNRIHNLALKEYAGKRMSFHDFQSLCERESDQNLDWFFNQWVRSTPYLSYRIVSQSCEPTDNGYRTEVRVERTGTLDMPVPVTVYFADSTDQTGSTVRLLPINTLYFKSDSPLVEAVLDADSELAMVIPPPDTAVLGLREYLSDIPGTADIAALPKLTQKALKTDIEQTLFWGKLGRTLYDWKFYEEALAVFKRRTRLLEELKSDWVVSAYGWQGLLLDLLGRRDEALAAYRTALENGAERDFSYEGDPVVVNRTWLEERLETPYRRSPE